MKRIILFLLAFVMLLSLSPSSAPAEDASEAQASLLKAYSDCSTISLLFDAAEMALQDGKDPSEVYDAMFTAAEENGFLREFQFALENTAAYGTSLYDRVSAVSENRLFDFGESPFTDRWESIGFNPYGHYTGSETFLSMISDPGARYCLEASLWTESDFSRVFGTSFNKFKPARPRAGYVCIVISDKSQNAPDTAWNEGSNQSDFLDHLKTSLRETIDLFEDSGMTPVFTGNPDLASSFWVFDLHYPFQAWYGHNNRKEVRGFGCDLSLNIFDAVTHRSVTKASVSNRLARTIYFWHDGIAEADVPYLPDSRGFAGFASKAEKAIDKQYSTEDLTPRMTPVSVAGAVDRILQEQGTDAGPWIAAICENGARNVSLGTDSVTFTVRSFDPGLKALGAYAKAPDGSAWLQTALDNAAAYNLELTLPVEDGRLTAKAKTTLTTALKKAATTAENAFRGKDMASALMNRFFPVPVEDKKPDASALLTPSASFAEWYATRGIAGAGIAVEDAAMICYAQKNLTLNAKPGPHSLEITCTGADPSAMLAECAKKALDTLAFAPADSRGPADSAADALNTSLAAASLAAHTKSTAKYTFTADLDDLREGKLPSGYLAYLFSFDKSGTTASLLASAEKLPDAQALSLPASKKLTGPNAGTRVIFNLYSGADASYVQVRSADSGETVASAFVLPGKKVTVQVPAGSYRLAFCSGPYWYGEEELFSALGHYYVSETTEILDRQHTHTFSLNPADKSELVFTETSLADFR